MRQGILIQALNKIHVNAFPGHKGRPGLRGGSVPRGADPSTQGYKSINDVIDDLGIPTHWNLRDDEIPYLWRSMSEHEYKNIKKTGWIQSYGGMNLTGQAGQTFYDSTPSRGYAEDTLLPGVVKFTQERDPSFPTPTFRTKVYIVGVDNLGPARFERNRQGEFYTTSPLHAQNIKYVIEGKQFRDPEYGNYVMYKVIKKP